MGFLIHISVRYINYVILSHTSLNTQLNSQLLSQGDRFPSHMCSTGCVDPPKPYPGLASPFCSCPISATKIPPPFPLSSAFLALNLSQGVLTLVAMTFHHWLVWCGHTQSPELCAHHLSTVWWKRPWGFLCCRAYTWSWFLWISTREKFKEYLSGLGV